MRKIFIILYLIPTLIWAMSGTINPKPWGRNKTKETKSATCSTEQKPAAKNYYGTLQMRAGYVGFTSNWFQTIFGHGSLDLEIEGSIKIAPCAFFWSNLNYTWKNGNSTLYSNHTHLDLAILSTGFNLATPILRSSTLLYFGLGISGACVHTSDHSSFLPKHTTRFGVGLAAKSGFFIPCPYRLFLNPFFDYYYQPIHARSSGVHSSVDVGGFRTGLGIGYCF
jgi:hypothetical protein